MQTRYTETERKLKILFDTNRVAFDAEVKQMENLLEFAWTLVTDEIVDNIIKEKSKV